MDKTESVQLKLKVAEAIGKDVGRALARIGPEDLERLQVAIGDTVEVAGKRATVCKVMPAYKELRGQSRVQLDGLTRENAGAALDEFVQVRKIAVRPAQRISLAPLTIAPDGLGPGIHRQPVGRLAGPGRGPDSGRVVWQPVR